MSTTIQDPPDTETPTPAEAAEAALVGAMLLSASARAGGADLVTVDDLTREAHRVLFATVVAMHEAGETVDPVTVNDRLVADGTLDRVGGALAVHDLASVECCPTPAAWETYATIVAREGRRQRLLCRLRRAVARLEDGADPDAVAAEVLP